MIHYEDKVRYIRLRNFTYLLLTGLLIIFYCLYSVDFDPYLFSSNPLIYLGFLFLLPLIIYGLYASAMYWRFHVDDEAAKWWVIHMI